MRRLFLSFLSSSLLIAAMLPAQSTQVSTNKPILRFSLPDFTPEGNRSWLVRGSEARYVNKGQADIKELSLSVFTGLPDGKVESLLLSPSAEIHFGDMSARGSESIRVINDRFDATGEDWTYYHKEKKVSINRNVRVVLHAPLNDILK